MNADGGMRISFAVAALIVVVCAGIGWKDHGREVALEKERLGLLDLARLAGIPVDAGSRNERATKVARAGRQAVDAKDFARRLIGMIKLSTVGDDQFDEEAANRMLDEMELLDPESARIILDEAGDKLDEETKQGVLAMVILCLGPTFPEESLALLAKTEDLDPAGHIFEAFISSTLARWAKSDPQGAVAWLRENGTKNPDQAGDDAKLGIIAGTAASDPRLAFQFIRELGVDDASDGVEKIMGAATNDGERLEIVKALREEIAKVGDGDEKAELVEGAYGELARGALDAGLANSKAWLEGVKMTPEEMEAFSEGVADRMASDPYPSNEMAGWLEWMGKAGLTETTSANLARMARAWTEQDHKAVSRWLESAPEGPLKELVAKGFEEGMGPKRTGADFLTPWNPPAFPTVPATGRFGPMPQEEDDEGK